MKHDYVEIDWSEEDKSYIVYINNKPITHGDTLIQAVQMLDEVLDLITDEN
jgi:predicted RNase H-like HicB family nuclease